MEKDEMYVVNQPKHSIVSLVVFNSDITDNTHKNIIKLCEMSDVVFIFPKDTDRRIDRNKLTTLYSGCSWMDSYDNLGFTIFKVLEYCINIFQSHHTYLITSISELSDICSEFFEKVVTVNASNVKDPIYKLTQLSGDEYKNIYTRKIVKNDSFLNKIRKFFGYDDELEEDNDENTFCSYTSESKVLVYFRQTILKLIEFNNSNVYSELFTADDPRYLFASMTKYLGIDIINCSVEDLSIGKL